MYGVLGVPARHRVAAQHIIGYRDLAAAYIVASALPLHLIKPFLAQMNAVDDLVKSLPELKIE